MATQDKTAATVVQKWWLELAIILFTASGKLAWGLILQDELAGYADYTKKVCYRILP